MVQEIKQSMGKRAGSKKKLLLPRTRKHRGRSRVWRTLQPHLTTHQKPLVETLAERIRRQKEQEEIERKAREQSYDAGLIGPGGVVAPGIENVNLKCVDEKTEARK